MKRLKGEVTEWSIVMVSKAIVTARSPWVRIPLSPPIYLLVASSSIGEDTRNVLTKDVQSGKRGSIPLLAAKQIS